MKWSLVEEPFRLSVVNAMVPGGTICVGSTSLTFRPHRQGSHRGQKMVYRRFNDEDRANARLIAAAPELLAALILCRNAINEEVIAAGDVSHPTIRRHAKAAEQADAAIAKAEGR
jgi:hypothetical protein